MEVDGAFITPPLSRSDQAELLDLLPEGVAQVVADRSAPGQLGEPGSAVILIPVSMATIAAIAAWVAAKGQSAKVRMTLAGFGLSAHMSVDFTAKTKPPEIARKVRKKRIRVAQ